VRIFPAYARRDTGSNAFGPFKRFSKLAIVVIGYYSVRYVISNPLD